MNKVKALQINKSKNLPYLVIYPSTTSYLIGGILGFVALVIVAAIVLVVFIFKKLVPQSRQAVNLNDVEITAGTFNCCT